VASPFPIPAEAKGDTAMCRSDESRFLDRRIEWRSFENRKRALSHLLRTLPGEDEMRVRAFHALHPPKKSEFRSNEDLGLPGSSHQLAPRPLSTSGYSSCALHSRLLRMPFGRRLFMFALLELQTFSSFVTYIHIRHGVTV
jgi:hypothetical protein